MNKENFIKDVVSNANDALNRAGLENLFIEERNPEESCNFYKNMTHALVTGGSEPMELYIFRFDLESPKTPTIFGRWIDKPALEEFNKNKAYSFDQKANEHTGKLNFFAGDLRDLTGMFDNFIWSLEKRLGAEI
jgi:hypothetical protein